MKLLRVGPKGNERPAAKDFEFKYKNVKLESGNVIANEMNKIFIYTFLALMFCNVSFAEKINSKLGVEYDISSKLLYVQITSNQETLIPKDDNDDTGFNILKNPIYRELIIDINNIKSLCNLIWKKNKQAIIGFRSFEECRISNIPNQGSSVFWKTTIMKVFQKERNIIKGTESRVITYLNFYKKTQYQISMDCDIKNCNKWIAELEKIAKSFKEK